MHSPSSKAVSASGGLLGARLDPETSDCLVPPTQSVIVTTHIRRDRARNLVAVTVLVVVPGCVLLFAFSWRCRATSACNLMHADWELILGT